MLRFVSKDVSWLYSINTQQFSGLLFRERCSSYIKDDKILSDDQFLDWKLRRSSARMLFCCSSSECNMPRSSSNYWSKNNDTVRDQLGWGEKNKHNVIHWQRGGTREDFFLEKEIFWGSWGILLEFYFFSWPTNREGHNNATANLQLHANLLRSLTCWPDGNDQCPNTSACHLEYTLTIWRLALMSCTWTLNHMDFSSIRSG